METLLTNKIVSMTELREPAKVLEKANGKPVAIMNRNQVLGYIVPANAVQSVSYIKSNKEDIRKHIKNRRESVKQILEYLKDK